MPSASRKSLKNREFQSVFRRGKGFKGEFVFLKILENNLGFCRFGFVVSGGVSKKATERNKIRRRLSHIVFAKTRGLKNGYDIVVLAKPEIKNKKYREIEKELNGLLAISGALDTNE